LTVIVHDECSADVKDLEFVQRILKPHKAGKPAVLLHCAMHCYRTAPFHITLVRIHPVSNHGHGAQVPIAITFVDSDSPVIQGMEN